MPVNPTYVDVMALLVTGGLGTIGVDLFGGEWGHTGTQDVDEQVLVLEGVGFPSPQPDVFEQPGVQILVRGPRSNQPDGRDIDVYVRAKAISDYLLTLPDTTEVNSVCYKGFEEGSNIAPLGKDENKRFIYSLNFFTWRNGAAGP